MCGIGAFQLKEGEGNPVLLAQSLLRELEVRGKDASGIGWHEDSNNKTWVMKLNVKGSEFAKQIKDEHIGRTAIVHTRFATQGHQSNMMNNHPLDVDGIVGVHNGHISNDDLLISKCRNYKRKGKVDSEAAFAYLAHGPKARGLSDRLSDIRGGAALIWLNSCGPRKILHLARLTSSPLCFGRTAKGSIVVASTRQILEKVCSQSELVLTEIRELQEGTYIRFEKGEITQIADIEMPKPVQPSFSFTATTKTKPEWDGFSYKGRYENGIYKTGMDVLLEELELQRLEQEQDELEFATDLLADEQDTLWNIYYKEGE